MLHTHSQSVMFVTYPLCFLTAYKMTSHPTVLAWASDSKTQTYTTVGESDVSVIQILTEKVTRSYWSDDDIIILSLKRPQIVGDVAVLGIDLSVVCLKINFNFIRVNY